MQTLLARALAQTFEPAVERIMKDRFWQGVETRERNAVVLPLEANTSRQR